MNLGDPTPMTGLEKAMLNAAGLDGHGEDFKRKAAQSGSFADKVRYHEHAGYSTPGATLPSASDKPRSSNDLFADGLREERQKREADRAATAAAPHDPKATFVANHMYPLPADAASKLGNDETKWPEEATALSLQHRFASGMKMNSVELMTLALSQDRSGGSR